MRRKRELSLVGALVFCAVAIAVHQLLKLPWIEEKAK
jgi:hypothetical protein